MGITIIEWTGEAQEQPEETATRVTKPDQRNVEGKKKPREKVRRKVSARAALHTAFLVSSRTSYSLQHFPAHYQPSGGTAQMRVAQ